MSMTATPPTETRTSTHELVGPAGAPVILALGGISATRHVVSSAGNCEPGWWECLAGPGRTLDVSTRRILGVDFLDGGCGRDGRPLATVTTHDQAAGIVALLDNLRIERIDTVIGASYGGMVALALAERWPERVGRLIALSAPHAPHPMSTALRAVQRRIVELGLETGRAAEAMALGRAIAMTTYRTAGEFAERFDAEPIATDHSVEFDVERYLLRAGEKFAERIRPERFLALSLSVDLHRVVPECIQVPTTVIGAQGDTLVPAAQLRTLAQRLPQLRAHHTIRTRFGHDAFLTEPARLGKLLTSVLAD
jgi:homoserine O-acetyltransferase